MIDLHRHDIDVVMPLAAIICVHWLYHIIVNIDYEILFYSKYIRDVSCVSWLNELNHVVVS